ncbi:MAG: hypothetical protein Tsb0015_00200 [Simkaniaceae bacterium]
MFSVFSTKIRNSFPNLRERLSRSTDLPASAAEPLNSSLSDGFFEDGFTKAATEAHEKVLINRRLYINNSSSISLMPIKEKGKQANQIKTENRETIKAFKEHVIRQVGIKKFERIQREYQINLNEMANKGEPLLPEHVYIFNIGMNHLEIRDFYDFRAKILHFAVKYKDPADNQTLDDFFGFYVENEKSDNKLALREIKNLIDLVKKDSGKENPTKEDLFHFLNKNFSFLKERKKLNDLVKKDSGKENPSPTDISAFLDRKASIFFQQFEFKQSEFSLWVEIASIPEKDLDKSYTGKKITKPIKGSYSGSGMTTWKHRPWVEHQELQQISSFLTNLDRKFRRPADQKELKPEDRKKIDRIYYEFLVKVVVKKHLMRQENLGEKQTSSWNLGTILPSPYKDSQGNTIWYRVSKGVDGSLGKMWYVLEPISQDKDVVSSYPKMRIYRDTSPNIYYQSGGPTVSRTIVIELSAGKRFSDSTDDLDREFFDEISLPPVLAYLYSGKEKMETDPESFVEDYLKESFTYAQDMLKDSQFVEEFYQKLTKDFSPDLQEFLLGLIEDGFSIESIKEQIKEKFPNETIDDSKLRTFIEIHKNYHVSDVIDREIQNAVISLIEEDKSKEEIIEYIKEQHPEYAKFGKKRLEDFIRKNKARKIEQTKPKIRDAVLQLLDDNYSEEKITGAIELFFDEDRKKLGEDLPIFIQEKRKEHIDKTIDPKIRNAVLQLIEGNYSEEQITTAIQQIFPDDSKKLGEDLPIFIQSHRKPIPLQAAVTSYFKDRFKEALKTTTELEKKIDLLAPFFSSNDLELLQKLLNGFQPNPLRILGNSLGGFDAQYDVVRQLVMRNRMPIIPIEVYAHSSIRVENQDNERFCEYLRRNKWLFEELNKGKEANDPTTIKFHFDYITQKGDIASELGDHHTFLGYTNDSQIQDLIDFELRVFQPKETSDNPEVNLGLHFNRVEAAEERVDFDLLEFESPGHYNEQANNSLEKFRKIGSKLFDWIIRKAWGTSRKFAGRRGFSDPKLATAVFSVRQEDLSQEIAISNIREQKATLTPQEERRKYLWFQKSDSKKMRHLTMPTAFMAKV